MRRRTKITNETQKVPLTPEAQDIKHAIQQTHQHPIEQVIFVHAPITEDDDFLQHEPHTNRYTFKYPETWRTIPNMDLSIGVRNIHLHHAEARTYSVTVIPAHFRIEGGFYGIYSDHALTLEKTVHVDEEPDFSEWKTQLNDWTKTLYDELPTSFLSRNHWTYTFDRNNLKPTFHLVRDAEQPEEIRIALVMLFKNVVGFGDSFQCLVDGQPLSEEYRKYPQLKRDWSDNIEFSFHGPWTSYSEYLLAASFVGQSRRNYLGFTNTQFNPPKIYRVPQGDTHFHIDLYSSDATEERELPTDGRDFIAVEIQLMSEPMTTRL